MSNTLLVGDLHLGHKNICKYRPSFSTPKEHDDYVTESVLSSGGKRDTLILFGDCFFTDESLSSLREFRDKFGKIIFILGNHDTDNVERQGILRTIVKEDLVHEIHSLVSYKEFWFSHAPIHHEELRGKRNVHGHCHNYTITDTENYKCVSLEQIDFKPITLQHLRNTWFPKDFKSNEEFQNHRKLKIQESYSNSRESKNN